MNDQEKESIKSILTSALHNAGVVKDQLESLVNPEDKSFKDYPMNQAVKEMDEAITSIQNALDSFNG